MAKKIPGKAHGKCRAPLRIFYFPSKRALTATLRPRNPLFSPVIDWTSKEWRLTP